MTLNAILAGAGTDPDNAYDDLFDYAEHIDGYDPEDLGRLKPGETVEDASLTAKNPNNSPAIRHGAENASATDNNVVVDWKHNQVRALTTDDITYLAKQVAEAEADAD